MVYSRKVKKFIPQGPPHRSKAAAEKDAKMFEDVQIDEASKMGLKKLSQGARTILASAINMSMDGVPGMDSPAANERNLGKFSEGDYDKAIKYLRKSFSKGLLPKGQQYAKEVIKMMEESVELDEAKAEFQFSDKATAQKFMREVSQARQGSSTGTSDGKVTTDFTDLGNLELKSVAKIMKKYGGKLIKTSERQMAKVFEEHTELEEERGSKIQVMVKGDRNAYERLTRAIIMGKVPGYEGAMFKGNMTTLTFDAKKHTGAVRRKLAKMIKDSGGEFDRSIEEQLHEKEFKAHKMYHPTTGEEVDAKTREDHLKFKAMGYLHDKPDMEEGFASDAQRRAAFASGYKAKGKKK
jgi:hypothetical protein